VDRGEFTSVLGPNGAGKTTLLKILSALIRPTSGEVWIDGERLGDDSTRARRKLGVISHHPYLYDSLTAWENLIFYGRMYQVPELRARVEEVLEQVGLGLFRHDPVRTFSRGMTQRLSIARAILHDPAVLLLDEPYTGLDQQATEILSGVLRRFKAEGRTVVMITHHFEETLALSDCIVILCQGRVLYEHRGGNLDLAGLRRIYRSCVEGGAPCPS